MVKQYFFGSNQKTDWKVGSQIIWTGEYEGTTYVDKGVVLEYLPNEKLSYSYLSSLSGLEDKSENYLLVAYEVKPGTQTDTKVRLRGKGVPSLRNKDTRGDHYVTLVVKVPDKLSQEAKDLLKKFDQETGNSLEAAKAYEGDKEQANKKKKGFFK